MTNSPVQRIPQPRRWRLRFPWLFFGFFLLFLSVTNAGYFDVSDAEERFLAVRALLDTGSPLITRYWHPTPYAPIYTLGPGISALPFFGLAEIIHKLELSSLPRYQLQVRAVLVGTAFYSALWMVLVARLAQLFTPSRRKAVGIAMLVGLTTLVLPYSKSFQSENLVGLLVTACVYCAFQFGRNGERRWAVGIGVALGAAFSCKIEIALAAPLLAIFVLASRSQLGRHNVIQKLPGDYALIALGALPGIAVVLWYNWIRFGTIVDSGYGPQKFSYGFLSGMHLQWLSPGKGLLWYCPVLFVGFYYVKSFWLRFQREAWLPLTWWFVMTALYAHWHSPVGETSLGPRFMVSYLPFGVLPLVMMDWKQLPRAGQWLTAGIVTVSLYVTALCTLVAFPIYHSRRWNTEIEDHAERYRRLFENWYIPEHSPLRGYKHMVSEGILDLWGVRYAPGEAVLVIQPLWWVLAGAAVTCLVLAWLNSYQADKGQGGRFAKLVFMGAFLPLLTGCILGAAKVGYPESTTLRVTWARPGWATYTSMARAINFDNIQEEAAFRVLFYEDISAEWRGRIHIPNRGFYRFQLESQNYVRLEIDEKPVAELHALPDNSFTLRKAWRSVWLEEGWHNLRVRYRQNATLGTLHVRWRPPGAPGYENLSSAELAPP